MSLTQHMLIAEFEQFFKNFKVTYVIDDPMISVSENVPKRIINMFFEVDVGTHVFGGYVYYLGLKKLPYELEPRTLVNLEFESGSNKLTHSCFSHRNVSLKFLDALKTNATYKRVINAINIAFNEHINSENFLLSHEAEMKENIRLNLESFREQVQTMIFLGMSSKDLIGVIEEEYINEVMEE